MRHKSTFGSREVGLLGYLVSGDGSPPNPEKVETIRKLSSPASATEVHSFLGLTSYYGQVMQDYSKVAEPLSMLTRKGQPFIWGEEQDRAFKALKDLLYT